MINKTVSVVVESGMFPIYLSSWKPTGNVWHDLVGSFRHSAYNSVPAMNETHTLTPGWNRIGPSRQVWQRYPNTAWLYPFELERGFDGSAVSEYMRYYPSIPIFAVVVYGLSILFMKYMMKYRSPFRLRYTLAMWNLTLSLFSTIGALRTLPRLAMNINDNGLYYSICHPPQQSYGVGASGLWAWLFCMSKLPELLDTAFILAKKKPLLFLHWYHHITVLLYCWHAYATQASTGLYFICMNFVVHSVMYMYYCLTTFKLWPRFIPPFIITLLQLTQMAVGSMLMMATYYYKSVRHLHCNVQSYNFIAGSAMYLSYFALFANFIVRRYIWYERKPKTD